MKIVHKTYVEWKQKIAYDNLKINNSKKRMLDQQIAGEVARFKEKMDYGKVLHTIKRNKQVVAAAEARLTNNNNIVL